MRRGNDLERTRPMPLRGEGRSFFAIREARAKAGASHNRPFRPRQGADALSGSRSLTMFAGIAELERSVIVERTERGRGAALRQGAPFGSQRRIALQEIDTARGLG